MLLNFLKVLTVCTSLPQNCWKYKKKRKCENLNTFSFLPRKIIFIPDFLKPFSFAREINTLSVFERKNQNFKKLGIFFRISLLVHVFGYFIINLENLSIFLTICSSTFNSWVNFSIFSFMLWTFSSKKIYIRKFFTQLSMCLFFSNLLSFAGNFLFLYGKFFQSGIFLILAKTLLAFNIWFPSFQHLQISNRFSDSDILIRYIKKQFLITFLFETVSKFLFGLSSNSNFSECLTFPFFIRNWSFSAPNSDFAFFMETTFKFQTISVFILASFLLLCLYHLAFFSLKEIKKNDYFTNKGFYLKDELFLKNPLPGNTNPKLPNPVFLKSNEKSLNYIGDLMEQELNSEIFQSNKKTNSWSIKKKGVNIPFNRIIWNNELPFSKQGLWYEIKKK
mmetsp:Transcript_42852/g.87621  ORF Transcript_42852/g.87621 Transcript_42852/m.87621 type:complete len:391 (+) Transcript_42852:796-1968(+)